jgi:hypothetical protein
LVSLNKIPFGEHVNPGVRLTLYMLLLKFTKMIPPNDLTMKGVAHVIFVPPLDHLATARMESFWTAFSQLPKVYVSDLPIDVLSAR